MPAVKRYVTFSYFDEYPSGGWNDMKGSYDDLDEAKQAFRQDGGPPGEIVDLKTGEVWWFSDGWKLWPED